MTRLFGVLFFTCSLSVLLASTVVANTARAVSFDEKVRVADQIVLGKCSASRSAIDPTGRWIVTYSTFHVEQTLKGANSPDVTVVLPGGEVNGLHQETVGVPSFHRGDERLLFVAKSAIGPSVLYFDQGTYEVRNSGGSKVIQPVESSLVLVDPQTGVAHAANETPLTLDTFTGRVREVVSLTQNRDANGFSLAAQHDVEAPGSVVTATARFIRQHALWIALAALGLALAAIPLFRR